MLCRNTVRIAIAVVLIFSSTGCALKVMHRTNCVLATGDKQLEFCPKGNLATNTAKGARLRFDSLEFIHGKGHEFEDSLTFEAFKHLFTSNNYQTWVFERWVAGLNFWKYWDEDKWNELTRKRNEECWKLIEKAYTEYLKPEYSVLISVAPLALNASNAQSKGATCTIKLEDNALKKWFGFKNDIGDPSEVPGWLKAVSYEAIDDVRNPALRALVGQYTFETAFISVLKYSWHLSKEVVNTPFIALTPYKWQHLGDLERFAPQLDENDRIRYANIAYYYCESRESKGEADLMDNLLLVLNDEQASAFKITVQLIRVSRVNELLDELKERIDQYNFVADALGAEYGEPGRRVGSAVDKRLKKALKRRINEDYYSDRVVFKGEKILPADTCSSVTKEFVFSSDKCVKKCAQDLKKSLSDNGVGSKVVNKFMLKMSIQGVQ